MEYTGITFGLEVLISVIFGAGGALAVWFKLKGTVNIQAVEMVNLKTEITDLKADKKYSNTQIHKRVDELKNKVEKNRENTDLVIQSLSKNINEMELRILKAIHEIGK